MSPWLFALLIVGPAAFFAGFFIRPIFAGRTSSPPPVTFTDAQLKDFAMAVFAELEQPLADLATAVGELPAKVAAAVAAGDPAAAQDKADTIAAVQAGAAAAVDAINKIGQP